MTAPRLMRFAETLRRQFREAMQKLTRGSTKAEPTPRRRRTGETGRGFGAAARNITQRISVRALISQAGAFVWDTLTWLHLWQGNDPDSTHADHNDSQDSAQNHLSPHP